MEAHVTPETAKKLNELATASGRAPQDIVEDVLARLPRSLLARAAFACHADTDAVWKSLGFAEHLMTNAARVWLEASLPQRQQIQRAIFPEGLSFDGQGFGTAVRA